MRRVFSRFASLLLLLLSLSLSSAFALPLDESDRLPVFTEGNVGTDVGSSSVVGLLGSANLDTTYFGGTVWAPDSMRWEAIQDSCWTFDTGVGSHFNHNDPHVNPFKDPSLHAYMEGWIGIDNTLWNGSNFYGSGSEVNPYFRRMVEADFPVDVCVGTSGGLGGTASFWAGLLENEAMPLCFADGQGYGNGWNLAIEKPFTYNGGAVTLSYSYVSNTEPNFDYSYCEIDTSGMGDVVTVHTYTGMSSGVVGEPLVQGVHLPFNTGNTIRLIFRVSSDGAYSDEDGLYATLCGALAVDDISLTGAINDNSNFESGEDGWTLAPPAPGPGGDWSDIVALSDLPLPLALCECDLEDSVLVFNDNTGGKTLFANNTASSPWIDLKAAGLAGAPGKFVETNIYANLPLLNYIFAQFNAQWYPTVCPDNGLLTYSGFESNGFVFYFGGVPQCTSANNPGFRVDFSDVIDPGAEQVRLSVGIVSYCRFFANCSGITNTTPWFDFVKLGVHGSPNAPILLSQEIHWPFDSFPQNGTLQLDAAGRIDGNDVKGASSPQPGTSLGDTLIVTGGGRGTGNNTNTEVYVQFMVDFGPGAPQPAANDWLASHDFEGMWNGQPWFSARIDTAEQGGQQMNATTWMTAYHEDDPRFSGSDTDIDPNDPDALGNLSRLANDIFPEGIGGLFTMGTRVNLFYKARYTDAFGTPTTGEWCTYPDTSGGRYLEMEVLPSSAAADSTWNCLLYVNHFDGEGVLTSWGMYRDFDGSNAQARIESALTSVLGTGSGNNFEQTPWDRWNVTVPASQQASFGRPLNSQYGADLVQALAYKTIIWNSGNLGNFNLVDEDANVLAPWLSLTGSGLGDTRLYLSGDGLAESMTSEANSDPSALSFLNDWLGVMLTCGTIRDAGCPVGTVLDETECIDIVDTGGAVIGNAGGVVLQGNGCPQRRSFDLLEVSATAVGSPAGDESYSTALKGAADFHSVTSTLTGGSNFKTVLDGGSVHYRRDQATCADHQVAVTDRITRVLNWFGYSGSQSCADFTVSLDIPDGDKPRQDFKVALSNFAPNPLTAGRGSISFSLPTRAEAVVEVFDVNGRLVKVLFDSVAEEGVNEVFWNGTDNTGASVASGVYFYQLRIEGSETLAKKMLVIQNGGR